MSSQSFSVDADTGRKRAEDAGSATSCDLPRHPPSRYAWYVVAVLMVVFPFSKLLHAVRDALLDGEIQTVEEEQALVAHMLEESG